MVVLASATQTTDASQVLVSMVTTCELCSPPRVVYTGSSTTESPTNDSSPAIAARGQSRGWKRHQSETTSGKP